MIFSLVLCTYNSPTEHLIRAFKSFEGFNNKEFELIIVNDGSDKIHTSKLIRLINDSNFQFTHKIYTIENRGLAAARNYGIIHSIGRYIGFMDSDDFFYSSEVILFLTELKKDFDVVEFSIETVKSNNEINIRLNKDTNYYTNYDVLYYFNKLLENDNYFAPAQYRVYLREYLLDKDLTFFEGILHEDEEWMPRVYFTASNLSLSSIISYRHYQNTRFSITRSINPTIKIHRAIGLLNACDSMVNLSALMGGELQRNFRNYIAKIYLQIPLNSTDIKLNRFLPLKFSNEPRTFIKSIIFLFGNRFYLSIRQLFK